MRFQHCTFSWLKIHKAPKHLKRQNAVVLLPFIFIGLVNQEPKGVSWSSKSLCGDSFGFQRSSGSLKRRHAMSWRSADLSRKVEFTGLAGWVQIYIWLAEDFILCAISSTYGIILKRAEGINMLTSSSLWNSTSLVTVHFIILLCKFSITPHVCWK